MTDADREWMTGILDDEYNRGRADGLAASESDRAKGEWIMFAIGCIVGPLAIAGAQLLLA